jgi:hypothetical protein
MRILKEESTWNSKVIKILYMVHVIQLIMKAILKSFNVETKEEAN